MYGTRVSVNSDLVRIWYYARQLTHIIMSRILGMDGAVVLQQIYHSILHPVFPQEVARSSWYITRSVWTYLLSFTGVWLSRSELSSALSALYLCHFVRLPFTGLVYPSFLTNSADGRRPVRRQLYAVFRRLSPRYVRFDRISCHRAHTCIWMQTLSPVILPRI